MPVWHRDHNDEHGNRGRTQTPLHRLLTDGMMQAKKDVVACEQEEQTASVPVLPEAVSL